MHWLRSIFCLYVVLWFNFVVPGHTRGIIALPTGCETSAQAGSCCPSKSDQPRKSSEPTPEQKRNCAICYVAATYMAAAWFTIDLAPSGDLVAVHRQAVPVIPSVEFPLTHYATGPPTCA